jgi:hypothetical protein
MKYKIKWMFKIYLFVWHHAFLNWRKFKYRILILFINILDIVKLWSISFKKYLYKQINKLIKIITHFDQNIYLEIVEMMMIIDKIYLIFVC